MEPGDESQDPQMCIDPVLDTITVESDGAALCLNTQPSIPGRLPSEPVTTKDASPSAESQQPLALEPRQTADERPLPLGNQDLDILRPADLVRSEPRGPAQGDVSSHAVFSWDLPSPWPLNSIDMSFNMAESPHQLPSLPQTGLTPFFWEDFSRSESVGSIGLVLSPANLGSQDDGSASGSTVGDHSMPWMAPWAPLANVTDILSSESTSQLYRAVPKVTDADVQKYWDLYFDRFHPVGPLILSSVYQSDFRGRVYHYCTMLQWSYILVILIYDVQYSVSVQATILIRRLKSSRCLQLADFAFI